MKIALVGYGKMGKIIEQLAPNYDMEVAATFDIDCPLKDTPAIREQLEQIPVLIEFSTPGTVMDNIKTGLALGKQMVIGTTSWHDHLESVKKQVTETNTGLVYASNFSLGVNLFYEILRHAGRIISKFDNYDPFIEEAHHQFKKDAPSGTALVIKDIVQEKFNDDIPVSCVRAGYIPGTHAVSFDSRVDTIRLEHVARNREGFAEGALIAAKWIARQKGCFGFDEVLRDILV
ncbi:4-hydroxy-tetrahydrodipicolinate reductase [bacterium]